MHCVYTTNFNKRLNPGVEGVEENDVGQYGQFFMFDNIAPIGIL